MQISKGLVFDKAALASLALGGFLFFAGAPAAKADDCAKRIRKVEHNLHEAIEDHGYYSQQADRWRHERREAYERCYRYGYYHRDRYRNYNRDNGWYDRDGRYHDRDDYRYERRYWDPDRQEWRYYRDRDRNWDRDRD